MTKEIESVVKNFPTKNNLGWDGEFYWIFKEELMSILPKCFQKKRENSRFISQGQNHPVTKTRYEHYKKRKLQTKILINIHEKILNKILSKWI